MPREGRCSSFFHKLTRRKTVSKASTECSQLNRTLGFFDLTFLSISSMVGGGIYFMIGSGVKDIAGPSIIVSFVFGGLSALLCAICYASLGSELPKAGSTYTFVYVTMGEFLAFSLGWIMSAGSMGSVAAIARAWSSYLDSLFDHAVRNFTMSEIANWTSAPHPVASHPDLIATGLVIVIAFISSAGVNFSSRVMNSIAVMNISILLFISTVCFYYGNVHNWSNEEHGGFFPYGIMGTIHAATFCFYAFSGFDTVCSAAEETRNASKTVPRALIASVIFVIFLYTLTASGFTFLIPYYMVDPDSPYSSALRRTSPMYLSYIVTIGPLFGLLGSLMSSIFCMVRMLYAMADDGLLFSCFAVVNKHTKVMVKAIGITQFLSALLALLINVENLLGFISASSLICYSATSVAALFLQVDSSTSSIIDHDLTSFIDQSDQEDDNDPDPDETTMMVIQRLPINEKSSHNLKVYFGFHILWSFCLAFTIVHSWSELKSWKINEFIVLFIDLCFFLLFFLLFTFSYLKILIKKRLSSKLIIMPCLVSLSVFLNNVFLVSTSIEDLLGLIVFSVIGWAVYFSYGIRYSKESDS